MRVTQAEGADGSIVETALLEIGQTDVLTGLRLMQLPLEIGASPLVEHEHRLALGLRLFLLVGELLLMDFDVVFFSQVTQRLGVAELLMLHDEIYRATALATSKALANALGARDIK